MPIEPLAKLPLLPKYLRTRLRRRITSQSAAVALAVLTWVSVSGCGRYASTAQLQIGTADEAVEKTEQPEEDHPHVASAAGAQLISFGNDQYHAEAIVHESGELAIYLLGSDESVLQPVQRQTLAAYIKPRNGDQSSAIVLHPDPLQSDSQTTTSRFTAVLPQRLRGNTAYIAVPGVAIDRKEYMLRFVLPGDALPAMPAPLATEAARGLYLVAGGLYTEQDIAANGRCTPADKYSHFQPQHDPNPLPGDLVCPVTHTKANAECSWIIGGETYYFCCPPCIDEFLTLAKTKPDQIGPAESYRK